MGVGKKKKKKSVFREYSIFSEGWVEEKVVLAG